MELKKNNFETIIRTKNVEFKEYRRIFCCYIMSPKMLYNVDENSKSEIAT